MDTVYDGVIVRYRKPQLEFVKNCQQNRHNADMVNKKEYAHSITQQQQRELRIGSNGLMALSSFLVAICLCLLLA